jgi:tetratricopeptide (TPR) repeat protein
MVQRDEAGLELTGASAGAAEHYRQAVSAYHRYAGDPMGHLKAATEDSPGFLMAHVLKAYLTLYGGNAYITAMGTRALAAAEGLAGTARERGHLAAAQAMARGELKAAGRFLEDVSIAEPLDGVALQAGQLIDFLTGDTRMLRDRIGRALPEWSEEGPHYHAILGMMAFGLEETGLYDRAEAAGRRSIELEPRNGWARHAVAHVMEMQDRRADGVAWLRGSVPEWTEESFFKIHNWWHLSLFHLGLGQADEALALYDGPIFGEPTGMGFDLVDAAALLWRLQLMGAEVGARWEALADAYEAKGGWGDYAFDDFHGALALVGAGRLQAARAVIEAQRMALARPGDNAAFVAAVGLPATQALLAFGEGRFGEAADLLRGVRSQSGRFGGSHAQRDLIDLTLIAAARLGGETALERALLAERQNARPTPSR